MHEPTRMVLRNRFSKFRIPLEENVHTYELRPASSGTHMHYHFEWKLFGPLRLLGWLGRRVATKDRNLVFDALKASFEQD